jgi:nucleotide-binding universal stress UspA family protein
VAVDGGLIEGDAVDVLRERSETLDLMVMGSRAYGPVRRTLLGSVSPGLLVDCLCPCSCFREGPPRSPSRSPTSM